jgi:hypothetical protein
MREAGLKWKFSLPAMFEDAEDKGFDKGFLKAYQDTRDMQRNKMI